jgi:hypothetical protein
MAKMVTGKRAATSSTVGIPFDPFLGLEQDPAGWLEGLPERLRLYLSMRPEMPAARRKMVRDASKWAEYAARAIQASDPKSAAHAAARAALATHLVWCLVEQEGLMAKAVRDTKRQAGTGKARGSRRPALDTWLDDQLASEPNANDKLLWRRLPLDGAGLWLDIDRVCEGDVGNEGLTFEGFKKRATAARKRRK